MLTQIIVGALILVLLGVVFTPSIRNRITMLFKTKAHGLMDAIEDKVEILKQKLRELKESYAKAIEGLAEIKALEIRQRKDAESFNSKADDYLDKATKLKNRLTGNSEDDEKIKSDILIMLQKQSSMKEEANIALNNANAQKIVVDSLAEKVKDMKKLIDDTTVQITNLEAQRDAARVNKTISKEMSNLNFDGVTSQMDELKKDIAKDNAKAEAWQNVGTDMQSDEDRINKILNQPSKTVDDNMLNDFLSK